MNHPWVPSTHVSICDHHVHCNEPITSSALTEYGPSSAYTFEPFCVHLIHPYLLLVLDFIVYTSGTSTAHESCTSLSVPLYVRQSSLGSGCFRLRRGSRSNISSFILRWVISCSCQHNGKSICFSHSHFSSILSRYLAIYLSTVLVVSTSSVLDLKLAICKSYRELLWSVDISYLSSSTVGFAINICRVGVLKHLPLAWCNSMSCIFYLSVSPFRRHRAVQVVCLHHIPEMSLKVLSLCSILTSVYLTPADSLILYVSTETCQLFGCHYAFLLELACVWSRLFLLWVCLVCGIWLWSNLGLSAALLQYLTLIQ